VKDIKERDAKVKGYQDELKMYQKAEQDMAKQWKLLSIK